MSLLQMSLSGSVIILVIMGLRVLFLNHLPKKMFLVLWWIALFRLLLPVSLPSSFSIYSLLPQVISFTDKIENQIDEEIVSEGLGQQDQGIVGAEFGQSNQALIGAGFEQSDQEIVEAGVSQFQRTSDFVQEDAVSVERGSFRSRTPLWRILWLAGVLVSALLFLTAYIRSYKKFQISFPIKEESVIEWQKSHRIRRTISVRWSEYVSAPLTYGVIRPVVLLPQNTDWNDEKQLFYVLEHEFVHIRRFDMATKLLLTAVFCIHWFNPLVWIMYNLFNRDLEIACDDEVVRHFGEKEKSGYARTLIFMEEKKAGLTPLYNGFSKNAIEERVGAVMKIRKTSIIAMLVAVVLVSSVLLGFATTAKEKGTDQRKYLEEVFEDSFSENECKMLAALWIDGYEDMTVSEYQEKLWTMTDTPEYQKLIERFSQTEWAFEADKRTGEALEQYFHYFRYVFEPLCAERWIKREFSGAMLYTEGNVYIMPVPDSVWGHDSALFEYNLIMYIERPDKLTAGQYRDTYLQTVDDIRTVLEKRTETELADGQLMERLLDEEIKRIISDTSDENLRIAIDYAFLPIENLTEDQVRAQEEAMKYAIEQVEEELENGLGIYQEYGLTWEMIPSVDSYMNLDVDVHMYWQGKEVRGICDEERGKWTTFYTGNSQFASDAIDLYVVYNEGKMTGLRKATEQEALSWTQQREAQALEQEEDRYPPASKEDYDSLLALMKPNYQSMSVAAFDEELLSWCSEDYERMERISEDVAQETLLETLSDEEKLFVELTFGLSGEENHRLINNLRAASPQDERDVRYGWISRSFYKESEDGIAFVDLWYCFYWYITDREQLTVGQRDSTIRGFMTEVEQIVQSMELDELLTIEKSELFSILEETAQNYSDASDGLLKIEIAEDNVSIDRLDERGLLF